MKSRKGFTLIELLVVIAIIGILAAIVLVSLRNAPQRAKDAAIKSDLGQIRAQAELLYIDNNNSYTGLCGATANDLGSATELATIDSDLDAQGTTFECYTDGDNYCVTADLLMGGTFCIDSNGMSKVYGTGTDPADTCDGTTFACQ